MHAAESRMARVAESRFREAVEAVRIGYVIARNKKAATEWQRWRPKGAKRQVGLTGEALERAMSGILLMHPEYQKGVPRPFNLQPNAMRKPDERLRQLRAAKRAAKKAKG